MIDFSQSVQALVESRIKKCPNSLKSRLDRLWGQVKGINETSKDFEYLMRRVTGRDIKHSTMYLSEWEAKQILQALKDKYYFGKG